MEKDSSKQFDEIMGRNYSPEEHKDLYSKAAAHDLFYKTSELFGGPRNEQELSSQRDAILLSRARNFPDSMIKKNEHGELEVQHTSPSGWKHTWGGGAYIEHHHPKYGAVDVTNISTNTSGEQHYEKGLFTPHEFLQHASDFEKTANEQDYK